MSFRYGFANMNFDRITEAANAGSDYQELNFKGVYNLSEEEINQYLELSERLNIKFETANGMLPGDIKVVGDDIDSDRIDEFLSVTFEKAAKLGVKYVVFGSSGARNLPRGYDYNVAFEQMAEFLKNKVAVLCEKYDTYCVLENLSWNECNTLVFVDELYKLCKAVNNPRIQMLVDFYHFGFNNDSYETLKKAQNYIKHIHVASVLNGRLFPAPNDGDIENYKRIIRFLKDIGYDKREGRITFEAKVPDGKDFSQCAKESLEVFKVLE